jgi:leucyl aminopeptidase
MNYSIKIGFSEKQPCGCLVLGVFEKQQLTAMARTFDRAFDGLLSTILKRDQFKAKAGDTLWLNHLPECPAERILLIGLGPTGELSDNDYRKAVTAAVKALKSAPAQAVVWTLPEVEVTERDVRWTVRQTVELFENTLYQFTQLKTDPEEPRPLREVQIWIPAEADKEAAESGLRQGEAIAGGVKLAKDLANLPGNLCTPTYLAEQAVKLADAHPELKAKILDEDEMEKLGMGALLSVSKGSRQPAKLIVLEYKGGAPEDKPVALIGKGLTFDAGGISLKPPAAMDEMKYDMCGGASVLGTMSTVASLALPINVIGIIPSSENLPDGEANKPGDIVTSMSGKTIEILNTDAEGRLILCDAITYAKRYDPAAVVDIATLTGACIIALGRHPSGLLGNDQTLCDALIEAGKNACDRVWQLPLWEEYQEQLKSNFADMANIGGKDAGTITAACFLARYTESFKWAHLDVAGTAWTTGKAKGATGRPVPLLAQYLIDQA